MKLHCLGGFREVGRNAIYLEAADRKIMFDYGTKVETGEIPLAPKGIVDALFLGHGHLDHTGSAALLYKKTRCKVFATAPTSDYADLLLHDSLKIAKLKEIPIRYSPVDILNLKRSLQKINYGDEVRLSAKTKVEVWDAGHLPGSCMFILNSEGKRIFYTSDFKLEPQRVVAGARFDAKDIDVVIMETTYSSREHNDRKEEEKKLYAIIKETVENGGIALLPVFAVRAPEILMILDQFGANWPIYLDGMAKAATNIAMSHPEFIKDIDALHSAVENAIPLYENEERNNALKEPCVILTTGAAMEGGPIVYYMKALYAREDCAIIFTGYQIPKTAGRYLLDTGQYILGAINFKVKMQIKSLDFSAHAGRSELLKFVQKVRPEKVICMHGEYCEKFATELKSRFGVDAIAPKIGDTIKI
ncbi:MAG: MBL fold metallo-hydrolase [Candidatus Nanoarchaeia archaeon]